MEVIMEVEQTEENLIHCIYASAASREFTPEELEELLVVARKNNEALGVTGMLLYEKGSFFQILEGPAEAVEPLYAKIGADKRHASISKAHTRANRRTGFSELEHGACCRAGP